MGDKTSIGVAYRDQDLNGSTLTNITYSGVQNIPSLIVSSAAAFFSVTAAIAQPSGAAQAAVATDAVTTGSAIYGFTSAQATGIITLLNKMRTDLVALGLIKGS